MARGRMINDFSPDNRWSLVNIVFGNEVYLVFDTRRRKTISRCNSISEAEYDKERYHYAEPNVIVISETEAKRRLGLR